MFENQSVFPQNWSSSLSPIPFTGTHSGLKYCSLQAYWTTKMPRAHLCYPNQCLDSLHTEPSSARFLPAVGTQEHSILELDLFPDREIEFWKSMVDTWVFCLFVWLICSFDPPSSWLSIGKRSFYTFSAFMVLEEFIPLLRSRGQHTTQAWLVLFPSFNDWFRRWVCDPSEAKVSFSEILLEILGERYYLSAG